ncbi:sulfatase-like hydrolase/transferase [Candidatus Poribacteria bacterium]
MARSSNKSPNILIFLVDQMPFDVVMPEHPCHMPNARRLAQEGVEFTRTLTCSPHCCPSRATFMTGLYPSRHGVFNNVDTNTAFQRGLNPGVRTFSEHLKEAGYNLAYSGKWHISNEETPADRGWQELTGYQKNKLSRSNDDWDKDAQKPDPPDHSRQSGEIFRPGWGSTPAIGKKLHGADAYEKDSWYQRAIQPGIQAIPELAKQDAPWALCISTDMGPSTNVPADIADLYDPKDVSLPASFGDMMHDKPRVYQRMRYQLWGQLTEDEVRESIAHYWAVCTLQDRYLGDILSALEATGQADDTLVVFLSDHGDFMFAHGLRCLGIPSFREVYHVPAIVRWPRGIVNPGRRVDEFVSLADFAPTFLDLAGCTPKDRLTGQSLMPFLQDETPEDWPDAWYSQTKGNEVYYTQRIVQTKRWKYVCNWFDFDELYDLESDPHEMVNLAFPANLPAEPVELLSDAASQSFTPWPPLPPHLDEVRQKLLAKMWRFARREGDIIFNGYPPVALAPYGPIVGLREESTSEGGD